ncbi:MAG: Uncharacterized protein XD42_0049 [Thermodesulfobacterium sp. 37_54]|uniref:Uncharacterized protein n=2 Tax=Thermodesulfobacterium commune TaxID=1741 RepID=A0A075WRP3_9BACT|nr:hypothetical protein [Thermodesulfobacterium commune]KUJ98280.1 MAG: Uncharacterized protein XD42_0049 [Thermodesulfobacterium sp. 37_54]AIH03665.1 hypothetical protein HL41_01905 [Thermodesulfobacterium commune DSM 2178]KUK19871.1 MAG: Uncharacterized protein XD55_0046 [Thermodesulfobacterium commune]KUK38669.1 MAG: Uncharacterized protein XD67_0037 [Thermodesulfobacterium commune]HAA84597.1 hypothetical protein [Thermodesulfobacterium commune]
MRVDVSDLFLQKLVVGFFWKLSDSFSPIAEWFEVNKDYVVREIKDKEDLIFLIKNRLLKVLVIGVNSLEEAYEIKQFLDFKISVELRRELEVIYVSPQVQTLDPKTTFLWSANLVLNPQHLSEFSTIYTKGLSYWEDLYKHFKKTQKYFFEKSLEGGV